MDSRILPTVDIVANLEEPLPLLSSEYDLVLAKYVIEHLSWRKVDGFILEVARIVKTGGKAVIVTANLLEQAKVLVSKAEWDGSESNLIFGGQDHEANYHKCGFSPAYLGKLFREAGFSIVTVYPLPGCVTDMILEGTK